MEVCLYFPIRLYSVVVSSDQGHLLVFLTTKTVYRSGWFDGAGDDSSVLFSFIGLPVDVGMVSCKSSTK